MIQNIDTIVQLYQEHRTTTQIL